MPKTGKPIAGGVLNIVAGALSLLGFIGIIIAIIVVTPSYWITWYGPGPDDVFVPGIVETILWIWAIFTLIAGILPLLGGIYALQRKKWGLALAGSIVAILGLPPLGIAATVLIALSHDEFA